MRGLLFFIVTVLIVGVIGWWAVSVFGPGPVGYAPATAEEPQASAAPSSDSAPRPAPPEPEADAYAMPSAPIPYDQFKENGDGIAQPPADTPKPVHKSSKSNDKAIFY